MNLRKEAKGRECQVRIPGHCTHNPEETVLAHDCGGGVGAKVNDLRGAWACYGCHQVIDGAVKSEWDYDEIRLMFVDGILRTQDILVSEEKVKW